MFKVKIKFALRRWQPTPVFLSGKYHGPRSLVGYRPWGRKELDMTERLHFTLVIKTFIPGLPGGLVIKTLSFHCRGHGFNPWSGNSDPTCPTV